MADEKQSLITAEILKERFIEKLKGVKKGDGTAIQKVLFEHMTYSLTNYDHLTPEAQKIVDEQGVVVRTHVEDILKDLPDSVLVRQGKRLIRGSKNKRWHVNLCIDYLEKPVKSPTEIELRCKAIFDKYMQTIIDMYQDILEHSHSGPAIASQLALFSICFDELFVAFHLSQRSYVQQAFSHLRTIQEALNLINLFRKKPEEANLWASDEDGKKIWEKLKPSKVKKKIGNDDIFDKFYHLFSDIGVHPSFNMMRLRCKALKEKVEDRTQIYISVGGTPKTKEAYFCHFFIILAIVEILGCMFTAFDKYLSMKELKIVYEDLLNDFKNMIVDMLIKPRKDAESVEKIENAFKLLKENLKKVFDACT